MKELGFVAVKGPQSAGPLLSWRARSGGTVNAHVRDSSCGDSKR